MTDLDKLIEAVETDSGKGQWGPLCTPIGIDGIELMRAHYGSLDAAKALHEALLPDHKWGVLGHADGSFGSGVGLLDFDDIVETSAVSSARAWLLAILKAYREQEQS